MNYIDYAETYKHTYTGKVFLNGKVVKEFEVRTKRELYELGQEYGITEYRGFTFG